MSIIESAKLRYATKAFDNEKKLTEQQIKDLKTILRLSPSSLNYQPWHFLMVTNEDTKDRLALACPDGFAYNGKKIKEASLVVVFCTQKEIDSNHIDKIIDQENDDKRYANEKIKDDRLAMINGYIHRLNEMPANELQAWLTKQCYIALGNVLLAASDMGIDSVPIEGFDSKILDKEFNLADKGLQSVVIAAFGYRSKNDFNATLPKSRLPEDILFTDY
ncbi:MAG: oxygen-insensitive NAD(P)H nitroreductase [Gammaproteobacteria bacterium]|nr:oxygen-insensitive NAD(P)H nitroreductase [Gammaproteobacteria bacterium]